MEGLYYYLIQTIKTDFSNKLQELRKSWIDNNITQTQLNEFLLIPNSFIINNNKKIDINQLDDTFTTIEYFDVKKLRGPSKLAYSTKTEKFSNAIMITYEYTTKGKTIKDEEEIQKKTSIRIYKNGLINLINVPSSKYQRDILYKSLIDRINIDDSENINIDNFNTETSKITNEEYEKYTIVDEISYIHSINSQFSLWENKEKYIVDLNKLNNIISPYNSSGKIVSGKYTDVSELPGINTQIIKLEYENDSVYVVNWEYILSRFTRNQSNTRDGIKCIILPIDGIKITLQLHKHGTVQMSMSYCNLSDLRSSTCTKIVDKIKYPLTDKYFEVVKRIFVGIFTENYNLVLQNYKYNEENGGLIRNTVSGKAPPNKPNTTTAVCRNKEPRQGFPGQRPIPYSFSGSCPETRQYIDPYGVLGNDGLYYPCCSAKTKISEEEYKKYLKNGFPKNDEEAEKYGLNSREDSKSGVLIPGTINIGSYTRAKINGNWTPVTILGYKGKSSKKQNLIVQLSDKKVITVNREDLERDSRYFPGLKSFKQRAIN